MKEQNFEVYFLFHFWFRKKKSPDALFIIFVRDQSLELGHMILTGPFSFIILPIFARLLTTKYLDKKLYVLASVASCQLRCSSSYTRHTEFELLMAKNLQITYKKSMVSPRSITDRLKLSAESHCNSNELVFFFYRT